ncbi:hypothetical protein ACROYT_G024099 [Oculina patagonica]
MADKDNDWNVPSSDGEEDSPEAAQSQGEEKWEVPLKVLLLYSEIEKNGFIELKVKECRSGENLDVPKSDTVKEQETPKESDATEANADPEATTNEETSAQNIDKEKTLEPSAFDYTEESIDETSHITRKIPKTERFQRKRVGTLENVISDLKRFRDMDHKEATDTDVKATSNPVNTDAATKEESTAV